MSRYTNRRRFGMVRDRRVALMAVGMLTVAAAVTLPALASDAASGDPVAVSESSARTKQSGNAASNDGQGDGQSQSQGQNQGQGQGDVQNQGQNQGQNQNQGQADPGADQAPEAGLDPGAATTAAPSNPTESQPPNGQQTADGNTPPAAVEILGNTCEKSKLEAHDGFQKGNRCVSTQFGEVGNEDTNPSLMITSAPRTVRANRQFDLKVSTRNLVRDRFLGAAKGGYYKESSFLAGDGSVRGHFHTACRMLESRRTAPKPDPQPAFFVATEDGKGGRDPDTVTVRVSGLPAGLAQCAVWAGDGSHRIPMMQRANQIPAFDVVRIVVR